MGVDTEQTKWDCVRANRMGVEVRERSRSRPSNPSGGKEYVRLYA